MKNLNAVFFSVGCETPTAFVLDVMNAGSSATISAISLPHDAVLLQTVCGTVQTALGVTLSQ